MYRKYIMSLRKTDILDITSPEYIFQQARIDALSIQSTEYILYCRHEQIFCLHQVQNIYYKCYE